MAKETNISTSQELYNFIFEACNILRGPVSQDAFKEGIDTDFLKNPQVMYFTDLHKSNAVIGISAA